MSSAPWKPVAMADSPSVSSAGARTLITQGALAMTNSKSDVFDPAVQTANRWLDELMEELGWDDRQMTFYAFRVVLHALRDRLSVEHVADLGAQLPMLIRGLFYEGWRPSGKPLKERKKEEFLAHIEAAIQDHPAVYPEAVAWAVFKVLEQRVSLGEIEDIKSTLPVPLRSLWP
jgi:uncharacterized protein (DUF2267 family)